MVDTATGNGSVNESVDLTGSAQDKMKKKLSVNFEK